MRGKRVGNTRYYGKLRDVHFFAGGADPGVDVDFVQRPCRLWYGCLTAEPMGSDSTVNMNNGHGQLIQGFFSQNEIARCCFCPSASSARQPACSLSSSYPLSSFSARSS